MESEPGPALAWVLSLLVPVFLLVAKPQTVLSSHPSGKKLVLHLFNPSFLTSKTAVLDNYSRRLAPNTISRLVSIPEAQPRSAVIPKALARRQLS